MTRTTVTTGLLLAAVISLTACDPPGQPTPSPTVPTVHTSTTTPTPTPSPSQSSSAEVRKAEYDKAVAASIESINQMNRIVDEAYMGPAEKLPASLDAFIDPTGEYYKRQQEGLDDMRKQGHRFDRVSTVVTTWPVTTSPAFSGAELVVYTCIDASGLSVVDKSGRLVERGKLVAGRLKMVRSSAGQWRVLTYANVDKLNGFDAVQKCEAQPR